MEPDTQSPDSRATTCSWRDFVLSAVYWPIMIYQFVTLFFHYYEWHNLPVVLVGWTCFALFGVFGQWPIRTFKKHGHVPDGKSYVYTTTLVTRDLFAVVRHPQFTSWILFSVAMTCLTQTWPNVVLTAIVAPLIYRDICRADASARKKFGTAYVAYQRLVPKTNFLWGLLKVLGRRLRHTSVTAMVASRVPREAPRTSGREAGQDSPDSRSLPPDHPKPEREGRITTPVGR